MTKREKKVAKFVKQLRKANIKFPCPRISTDVFKALGYSMAPPPLCPPAFDESVLAPFIELADEMPVCQGDCPDSVRQVYLRGQDRCGVPSNHRQLPKAAFRALKEATQ